MNPAPIDPVQILLVEDDPDDVFLIQHAFEDSDPSVQLTVVNDGEKARAYLAREPPYEDTDAYPDPDLILLDIKLPRMNGLELLDWMKADPRLEPIPVYLWSSAAEHDEVQWGYRAGAHAYLPKDGDIRMLDALATGIATYAAERRELGKGENPGGTRSVGMVTALDPSSENAA